MNDCKTCGGEGQGGCDKRVNIVILWSRKLKDVNNVTPEALAVVRYCAKRKRSKAEICEHNLFICTLTQQHCTLSPPEKNTNTQISKTEIKIIFNISPTKDNKGSSMFNMPRCQQLNWLPWCTTNLICLVPPSSTQKYQIKIKAGSFTQCDGAKCQRKTVFKRGYRITGLLSRCMQVFKDVFFFF